MDSDSLNLYSDTISPVRRSEPDEVFVICIEGTPAADNPESAESAGAFITCWVDANDLRDAELRAIARIESAGWELSKFEGWDLVCRNCYDSHDPAPLDSIDEALKHGISITFHCWPLENP